MALEQALAFKAPPPAAALAQVLALAQAPALALAVSDAMMLRLLPKQRKPD